MKRAKILLSVVAMIALSACAEGRKASASDIRVWLPSAFPALKRVVVLLRTCEPKRKSGYNNVWASGDDGGAEPIHCSFGSDKELDEIKAKLRDADVLGVSYAPSENRLIPVKMASFILFREGMVTSGSSTTVEYHAAPQPCLSSRENNDGESVSYEPVTQAPCHWFWEHDDS